eukprot:57455_1
MSSISALSKSGVVPPRISISTDVPSRGASETSPHNAALVPSSPSTSSTLLRESDVITIKLLAVGHDKPLDELLEKARKTEKGIASPKFITFDCSQQTLCFFKKPKASSTEVNQMREIRCFRTLKPADICSENPRKFRILFDDSVFGYDCLAYTSAESERICRITQQIAVSQHSEFVSKSIPNQIIFATFVQKKGKFTFSQRFFVVRVTHVELYHSYDFLVQGYTPAVSLPTSGVIVDGSGAKMLSLRPQHSEKVIQLRLRSDDERNFVMGRILEFSTCEEAIQDHDAVYNSSEDEDGDHMLSDEVVTRRGMRSLSAGGSDFEIEHVKAHSQSTTTPMSERTQQAHVFEHLAKAGHEHDTAHKMDALLDKMTHAAAAKVNTKICFEEESLPNLEDEPPRPENKYLVVFWMLSQLKKSMVDGAFMTEKLFVSSKIWRQSGARVPVYQVKVESWQSTAESLEAAVCVRNGSDAEILLNLFDCVYNIRQVHTNLANHLPEIHAPKKKELRSKPKSLSRQIKGIGHSIAKGARRVRPKTHKVMDQSEYIQQVIFMVEQTEILGSWLIALENGAQGRKTQEIIRYIREIAESLSAFAKVILSDMRTCLARYMKHCCKSI